MKSNQFFLNSKYLLFLSILYCVFCLSADVMANRFSSYGKFIWSDATLIFPLTYLISDIITEVYGYKIARTLIWIILIAQFTFSILLNLTNMTHPANFFTLGQEYTSVINPIFRFVLAGTIANIASDFLNIYLISRWKILSKGKLFWLRSIGSTAISELLLVFISGSIAFFGTVSYKNFQQIILSAYALEMFYAFIFVWPGWAIASYLKKSEGIDVYDHIINYNPFEFLQKN